MSGIPQLPSITQLADAFEKLQKVGGALLVFEFIGTLLLFAAFFFGHGLTGFIVLILGCLIILTVLCYTLYFGLREYNKIKEVVSIVKDAAFEMSELASDLYKVANKYSEDVDELFTYIRQASEKISLLKTLQDLIPGFDKIKRLSSRINTLLHSGENLIDKINIALASYDSEHLRQYLSEVNKFDKQIKRFLE